MPGSTSSSANDALWSHPIIGGRHAGGARLLVLTAILDHMRSVLVLDDRSLGEDETRRLVQRANATLREPWSFDEQERLRRGGVATLPSVIPTDRDRDGRSAPRRTFCDRSLPSLAAHLGHRGEPLGRRAVEEPHWIDRRGAKRACPSLGREAGQPFGVQIMVSALRWRLGDGIPPPPDPVRGKSLHLRREDEARRTPNAYFRKLYDSALGRVRADGATTIGFRGCSQESTPVRFPPIDAKSAKGHSTLESCPSSSARRRWSWGSTSRTSPSFICATCRQRPQTMLSAAGERVAAADRAGDGLLQPRQRPTITTSSAKKM